jgi:hypothetical protein
MSLKTGVAMGLVMLLVGESYGGRMGIGCLLGLPPASGFLTIRFSPLRGPRDYGVTLR